MNVLVTGGAGYIGSIATRILLDRGYGVTVLDSLERGFRDAVDGRARFVQGDVGDPSAAAAALRDCEAVMHFAGYIDVAESERHPEMYRDNNAVRPLVLLDAMSEAGVKDIVFSSTAAVYGEPEEVPIDEDAAARPVNAYGASKLEFERSLCEREASGKLRAVRLRYFNVAGALENGSLGEAHQPETHIIPRVLDVLASGEGSFVVFGDDYPTPDGTCVRDYIHVVDLIEAHVLALERLRTTGVGGVFNLGNGDGYSNLEVVRTCSNVVGRELKVEIGARREGDPARLVASSRRARDELGWNPARASLRTIIEDAWRWHQGR